MNMAEMMGGGDEDRPRRSNRRGAKPKCEDRSSAGSPVGGMIGGLLGGRRKKTEDCDPT